ncbi:MAG: polysaccharide pyruvyl transferase family protein [Rhodobacter sp.]|nr:polysaccharide pyruvyl transferase family protein [Rhodobacter sp.]
MKLLSAILEIGEKLVLRPVGAVMRLPARVLAFFGSGAPIREHGVAPREVLVLGGYGYGNVGDEAQLGANLDRWRAISPPVEAVVLSPHPDYTADHHACRSQPASRAVIFWSNDTSDYNTSSHWFRFTFWLVLIRMELNARLMAAGLAPVFATAAEARLLTGLQMASAVHVSGGGFMTGPTRSRLWDTCLILRLCRRMGTPYFLTGQTIGIFQNPADRWLARTALRGAVGISLRDPGGSADELVSAGIPRQLVTNGVDDALFCRAAPRERIAQALTASGIAPVESYVAVNYHWWGMDAATRNQSAERLADILDRIGATHGLHVLLVPMVPSDEEALRAVAARMDNPAAILSYDYSYQTVRGVIAQARALISFKHHPLIFAMGEAVPCLSVSFDPYYHRKNKGAMANLGQERFCIDREGFFGPGLEACFTTLVTEDEAIRDRLRPALNEARARQDAVFADCVRATGLGG